MRMSGVAASLLAVALSLAVAGCGDEDPAGPDQGVFRMWDQDGREGSHLHIEPQRITSYRESDLSCYNATVFSVTERNGDVFSVSAEGGQADMIIRRAGDTLTLEIEGIVQSYTASDVDPDALLPC